MKPSHQVFFEPWSVILFVSFILKTTQWQLFLNLFVCSFCFDSWSCLWLSFCFPHLHMMALALALDQLPCSLLLLAELEIVDSLIWASVSQPSLLVCVMAKQSSQTTITFLCKPAASSTCFTLLQCSRSRAWLLMNSGQCKKLSFLRYLSWSSTSQKGKKEKGKNLRERKKLLFRIGCPKEAGILKSYKNPCPFPWMSLDCLWVNVCAMRKTNQGKLYFFSFYLCEWRQERRKKKKKRAERESLKCWVGLWAKAIASCLIDLIFTRLYWCSFWRFTADRWGHKVRTDIEHKNQCTQKERE